MTSTADALTLMAVGDVMVNRADPESLFAKIRPTLQQADIVFGNRETPNDRRPRRLSTIAKTHRGCPVMVPDLC